MMKKNFTFLLLLLPAFFFAQSQRMVLIEEGTNASCGPCAAQNPGFKALLAPFEDAGQVVQLHYQWYFPGFDPMNQHNPTEADGRFNGYYNESGVPSAMIDGVVPSNGSYPGFNGGYDGSPAGYSAQMINDRLAVPASFDIDITADVSEDFTTVDVSIDVTASEAITMNSNLKLQIAVIENEIIFETAPGSNGETEFSYVMKKMLPDLNGTDLPATWTDGQTETYTQSWTLANVYDIAQLAVVAFVQDNDDKSVLQAAEANASFTVSEATGAAATGASMGDAGDSQGNICEFSAGPTVTIRNQGNDDLTSLDIEYSINGSSTQTYNWTGTLPTLNSEVVELPAVAFFHDASGMNTATIALKNPNGVADPDMSDNTQTINFEKAPESGTTIEMTLSHDQYDNEISWAIKNSAGMDVETGGGLSSGAAGTVTETYTLATGDCYTFHIYDTYGDGQIGAATGLTLRDVDNDVNLVTNLADYGGEGKIGFGVGSDALTPDSSAVFTGIINADIIDAMNVYPNPATDVVNVMVSSNNDLTVEMIDVLGRKVAVAQLNNGVATFNTANLNSGIYFVNVASEGKYVATSSVMVK